MIIFIIVLYLKKKKKRGKQEGLTTRLRKRRMWPINFFLANSTIAKPKREPNWLKCLQKIQNLTRVCVCWLKTLRTNKNKQKKKTKRLLHMKQITQPNVRLDFLAPCRHDWPEENAVSTVPWHCYIGLKIL